MTMKVEDPKFTNGKGNFNEIYSYLSKSKWEYNIILLNINREKAEAVGIQRGNIGPYYKFIVMNFRNKSIVDFYSDIELVFESLREAMEYYCSH